MQPQFCNFINNLGIYCETPKCLSIAKKPVWKQYTMGATHSGTTCKCVKSPNFRQITNPNPSQIWKIPQFPWGSSCFIMFHPLSPIFLPEIGPPVVSHVGFPAPPGRTSGQRSRPVPICTAEAPSSSAAAVCRASHKPPVAITGICTASTICGSSASDDGCRMAEWDDGMMGGSDVDVF